MKKTLLTTLAIITLFVTSSCSYKVLEATTTHKQVMESYTSRDQIIQRFGLPTTKKEEGQYEEWYYDYGTKKVTDGQASSASYGTSGGAVVAGKTSAALAAIGRASSNNRTATNARVVEQELKSFVKFTLNGDRVVTWETNGVDYGKYEVVKKKMPLY